MKSESWWKPTDNNADNNLRLMLLYLLEILKAKQPESYESACHYVVEIFKYVGIKKIFVCFVIDLFRTYGIDPSLVNQILDILIDHLAKSTDDDPLDVHTVRTIGQFMIERKNIIVPLLDFALKYQPVSSNIDFFLMMVLFSRIISFDKKQSMLLNILLMLIIPMILI